MKSELAAGVQLREGTATLAVLWLARSLQFILEMLRLFAQRTKAPPAPPAAQHTHLARPQLQLNLGAAVAAGAGARLSASCSHSPNTSGGTRQQGSDSDVTGAADSKLLARSFTHRNHSNQQQQPASVQCDGLVQLDDANPDELVEIASEAYEKTLRKHHNWIVRGIVRVFTKWKALYQ